MIRKLINCRIGLAKIGKNCHFCNSGKRGHLQLVSSSWCDFHLINLVLSHPKLSVWNNCDVLLIQTSILCNCIMNEPFYRRPSVTQVFEVCSFAKAIFLLKATAGASREITLSRLCCIFIFLLFLVSFALCI